MLPGWSIQNRWMKNVRGQRMDPWDIPQYTSPVFPHEDHQIKSCVLSIQVLLEVELRAIPDMPNVSMSVCLSE